ncbi:morphogenic membrane protein MmpB [Streptomyces sp. BI20]
MLWSDPENEPPRDMREAQTMVRRLTLVLTIAMVVIVWVLGIR